MFSRKSIAEKQLAKLMAHPPPCVSDMDAPLLQLSSMPQDVWTTRSAFEGTAIFGRSGSGKSSGSGAAIAKAFLSQGWGGLVMCAKADEADVWERYAAETGRSAHVIRMDGSGRYRFNFLEYEMQRETIPADVLASNLVATLQTVIEVAARAAGLEAGNKGDQFWQKATRMMLIRTVDLLYSATGRVRLAELMDFITSAPTSPEQMKDEQWRERSFFAQTYRDWYATGGGANPPSPEDMKRLDQFWRVTYPNMEPKTRSNIATTLETDLEDFLRPQLRTIFSTDTNVVPELTHDGAILILDYPVLEWNETGVLAQMVVKYLWMKAAQRRAVNSDTRPLFLWADEGQLFISSYDMEFQSTARSSKTATVFMTQNLPSLYSRIGGQRPEHTVNAMMGNLKTKIFHQNDDHTTNQYAAELVGKASVWRASISQQAGWTIGTTSGLTQGSSVTEGGNEGIGTSFGTNSGPGGGGSNSSFTSNRGTNYSTTEQNGRSINSSRGRSGGTTSGMNEHLEYAVQPHEFMTDLANGGPASGGVVTGVVVSPGTTYVRNGKHWMQVAFKQ